MFVIIKMKQGSKQLRRHCFINVPLETGSFVFTDKAVIGSELEIRLRSCVTEERERERDEDHVMKWTTANKEERRRTRESPHFFEFSSLFYRKSFFFNWFIFDGRYFVCLKSPSLISGSFFFLATYYFPAFIIKDAI